jgi:pimeloyl-ACP methyl ester carboxylesterase
MYRTRKGWRYYRDSVIAWAPFILLLISASYALKNPAYWIVVLLVWFLRNPIRKAWYVAHPPRRISLATNTHLHLREVTFTSSDGLTLFGHFLPGRNKATILLVHGLGQANQDMLLHAEHLASRGFGIFMIDLRAHGSSDGDTSTNGLHEADDIVGAVDYLLHRIDVNGQKIGALGVSLGAQAVLRGALKTQSLRALALESLGPAALGDQGGKSRSLTHWLGYPGNWLYYQLHQFMSGGKQPAVVEVIPRIAPRPLLLIASGPQDIHFNSLFFQAAHEPRELWEIPTGEPGAAILSDSHAYLERLTQFFTRELLQEDVREGFR